MWFSKIDFHQPTILISPPSMKLQLLKELDQSKNFFPIRFMSLAEFQKKYFFDYDKRALVYLADTYSISPKLAQEYLEKMIYLEYFKEDSKTIQTLRRMKQDLDEKKLIFQDAFFLSSLPRYHLVFYGYDYYLKEEFKMIEELKEKTTVEVILPFQNPKKPLTVWKFSTMEEEISYVFEEISSLIEQGVSPSSIKLSGITEEYEDSLERLAKFYHLPLSLSPKTSLYETLVGKKVLQLLQEGKTFDEILLAIDGSPEANQIVPIFNSYLFVQSSFSCFPFIEEDMKNTYLEVPHQTVEIEIVSLSHFLEQEDIYVFILGFNHGSFPKTYKDDDFLSDDQKRKIGFSTSDEKNKHEKEALLNHLYGLSHCMISYKEKTSFEEAHPSFLIQEEGMMIKEGENKKIHYSMEYDQLKLTSFLDQYIQYGKKNPMLEVYYSNLSIPYGSYRSSYQKIDSQKLQQFLNQKLTLSYSALDRFFHCPFRYFLSDILKLDFSEDRLQQKEGNVFHHVLSQAFLDDFDFEESYSKELASYKLDKKEQFYFRKLKKELQFLIDVIQEQNRKLGFRKTFYEEKISLPISSSISVTLVGILDKIYVDEKNHFVSIIDYKTGNAEMDLKMIPYGFDLQLPIYLYLIRNSQKFSSYQVMGIYLQKVLAPLKVDVLDLEAEKKENLKLQGYTLDREDLLECWDSTYENSEVIKSLKKTKNGWYHYAKLLSEEEMNQFYLEVEEKIKYALSEILQADFSIRPKLIDGKKVGCTYCKFQDICYRREEDFVRLHTKVEN